MKPENRALAILTLGVAVVVAIGGLAVFYFGSRPADVVVPAGSYPIPGSNLGGYYVSFRYENNRTAAYIVTGAWDGSAPTQVIIAEELGENYAGCGFYPLNYPAGGFPQGCWPNFTATPTGSFRFTFHICILPQYLPTGSFIVIFRTTTPATVTVTQPFAVQESEFPQSSCASPGA